MRTWETPAFSRIARRFLSGGSCHARTSSINVMNQMRHRSGTVALQLRASVPSQLAGAPGETVTRGRFTSRYSPATVLLVREVAGGRYRFLEDLVHDDWIVVFGGGLPAPVDVRIERAADGRYAFTGLRLGMGRREEITSQTLREIRLGEIMADYVETFRPDITAEMEASAARASRALRPPRGPDHEALAAFARTYMTENPRRAMTAAARVHNISRATANRWAAICRELGYLPGSGPS
jgi:hypothetical protein